MSTEIPAGAGRRRGRRPALDLDRVVAATVRLADAGGLDAVSMRRLAGELGVAPMTLYGHVPGKRELADLMLDGVLAELYRDALPAGNWRARLDAVARANFQVFRRHPWAVQLAGGRPTPGPQLMRKHDIELRAVGGLGLSDVQTDLLIALVDGFVRSVPAAAPNDPEQLFEFGLERLLDGIGVLILDAAR
jgi:AcrR family transcriptional regulator